MAMTWLEIVQTVAEELGLSPAPVTVAGTQDALTRQLGALANRCGDMLMRSADWSALATLATISVDAPISRTGTTTANSPILQVLPDTTGISAGVFVVTGTSIIQSSRVVSVDSGTQVTLDQPATASTATSLTFSRDTYPIPPDWGSFINRTMWDRSRRWELLGPMSPQEDQWLRSGIVATGPRRRFRKTGRGQDVFRIWPPPTDVDAPSVLSYEYVSEYWATDAATGTPKARFTADDDISIFADNLLVNGTKWLWMQVKGFDYAAYQQSWQRELDTEIGQDKGARTLSLAQSPWPILIGPGNVPDSGFGV